METRACQLPSAVPGYASGARADLPRISLTLASGAGQGVTGIGSSGSNALGDRSLGGLASTDLENSNLHHYLLPLSKECPLPRTTPDPDFLHV